MFKTNLRLRLRKTTIKKNERPLMRHIRFLLNIVAPLLKLTGLKGSLRFADFWVLLSKTKKTDKQLERAKRIGELVQIASRKGIFQYDCLERSLVIWILLKREGIPADLRLGTRMRNAKVEAHAWIETNNEIVSETFNPHDRYKAFPQAFDTQIFKTQRT